MARTRVRDIINLTAQIAKLDRRGKEEVLAFVQRELAIAPKAAVEGPKLIEKKEAGQA